MAIDLLAFDPVTGFKDTSATGYPEPANETAWRAQLQDPLDQIRDYINNTLIPGITAADAELVIAALGLTTNSISDVDYISDDLITNDKLATDIKIGSLAALTTIVKTSIQAAINELVTNQGGITTLTTTAKTSLVAAINELVARLITTAMITDANVTLAKLGTDVPRILCGADEAGVSAYDATDYAEGTLYWWPAA